MLTFWAAPPPARLYGPSKEQAGAGSRLFRSQTSGGWSDSHPPGFSHLKTAFRPPRCKSTRGPTRLPPVRTRPRPRRPRAGTRLIPVSPAGGRTAPTRSLGHAWCPVCSLLCDVSGFVLGDFSAKIFEISCTTWGWGGVQGAQCPSAQMLASRRPSRQRTAGSPASRPSAPASPRSRTAGSCARAPWSPAGGPWDSAPSEAPSLSRRRPSARTPRLRPGFCLSLFALSAGPGGTPGLFLTQTPVPVSSRVWLWGPGGAPRVHLLGSGRAQRAPPRACARPAPQTGAPAPARQEAESVPGGLSCPIASLPVTGQPHMVLTSQAYISQLSGLPYPKTQM